MARVLFYRQLEQLEKEEPNGKPQEQVDGETSKIKHVKERLADTHDLLAEISLENERQVCYACRSGKLADRIIDTPRRLRTRASR